MGTRLQLQAFLETMLGSRNVYFQPPPDKVLQYPCFMYHKDDIDTIYADNIPYRNKKRYKITYVDENPDSDIPDKMANLPLCSFDRQFKANQLNHDVFNLYF